jgi:predicted ATPase with chaperone activity
LSFLGAQGDGYSDFAEVKGNTMSGEAVEVAAASGHNLLMMWLIFPQEP